MEEKKIYSQAVNENGLPLISIIIPVINNAERLDQCLKRLYQQSYPQELMEIIVVDNGSSDNSPKVTEQYPVKLLEVNSYKSPYLCKNIGMQDAQGDVFVFLDSNCIPGENLISEGVKALKQPDVDFAIGDIQFIFSKEQTISEMADSVIFYPNSRAVNSGNGVKGTLVFCWSYVMKNTGPFIGEVRSCGDIEWSERALNNGYKLAFAKNAFVKYPAKKFKPLMKKAYRIGRGFRKVTFLTKKRLSLIWYLRLLKYFIPPRPFRLKRRLVEDKVEERTISNFWSIWFVFWLFNFVTFLGAINLFGQRMED